MKIVLNPFAALVFTLFTIISCSPCNDAACNNGFCYQGKCRCEHGYLLDSTSTCFPYNSFFAPDNIPYHEFAAIDTAGNYSYFHEDLNLVVADTNPFEFILLSFNGLVDNDIVFRLTNSFLIEERTVITTAGKIYDCEGVKIGNGIQLRFKDTATQIVYTLTYTVL